MANNYQRKVINGINTLNMQGTNYVEVQERLRIVHERKVDFQVLESQPFQIADRILFRVVITVDGKQYVGNAEAKLNNARPNSPDASNPFECAETSALGRALAFAGFGTVGSIASFDEVARSQPAQEKKGCSEQEGNEQEATEQQINSIKKIYHALGENDPGNLSGLSYTDAKIMIQQLTAQYREMKQKSA